MSSPSAARRSIGGDWVEDTDPRTGKKTYTNLSTKELSQVWPAGLPRKDDAPCASSSASAPAPPPPSAATPDSGAPPRPIAVGPYVPPFLRGAGYALGGGASSSCQPARASAAGGRPSPPSSDRGAPRSLSGGAAPLSSDKGGACVRPHLRPPRYLSCSWAGCGEPSFPDAFRFIKFELLPFSFNSSPIWRTSRPIHERRNDYAWLFLDNEGTWSIGADALTGSDGPSSVPNSVKNGDSMISGLIPRLPLPTMETKWTAFNKIYSRRMWGDVQIEVLDSDGRPFDRIKGGKGVASVRVLSAPDYTGDFKGPPGYMKEATRNSERVSNSSPGTRVACVFCIGVYTAKRDEFGSTSGGTLVCPCCDIDAMVPIVDGSVLYGLSEEALMARVVQWNEDGFRGCSFTPPDRTAKLGWRIVGLSNGEIWGTVTGDEGSDYEGGCYRLCTGRIAKKETEGTKWKWEDPAERMQLAVKCSMVHLKKSGMTEHVAARPISELTREEFVFMLLDKLVNSEMKMMADDILSYVGPQTESKDC